MKCRYCGKNISTGLANCPYCGKNIHYDGNTVFIKDAGNSKVNIFELFGGVFHHHPKGSIGEVFVSGTKSATPNEYNMLDRWQRPWVFSRFFIAGLIFCLLAAALYFLLGHPVGWIMLDTVGAMVLPLTVLLFFWELNIPRNIPIYTVIGIFMIGGLLSLIFTLLESQLLPEMSAVFAPITEEPGKFLAAAVFISLLNVKYGVNGMLIGAAVGAGFACFENIYYILYIGFYSTLMALPEPDYVLAVNMSIQIFLLRNLGTLGGGHIFWAAAEGAALTLAKGNEKLQPKHFFNKKFLIYLCGAIVIHMLWNSGFIDVSLLDMKVEASNGAYLMAPILPLSSMICTVLSVAMVILLLKPCLKQILNAVDNPRSASVSYTAGIIRLVCINGQKKGLIWESAGSDIIIGRDPGAVICLPPNEKGVSRKHCLLRIGAKGWTITDLNSTYGTYTAEGKLNPNEERLIQTGEIIYLGSKETAFKVTIQ